MGQKINASVGILLVILMSTAIYVSFDDKAKIRVDEDKSSFLIKLLDEQGVPYGRWLTSGTEYNRLFNGTRLVRRVMSGTYVHFAMRNESGLFVYNKNALINESIFMGEFEQLDIGQSMFKRHTLYQTDAKIIDTYLLDGNIEDLSLFPVYHKIEPIDAKGLFYRYTVDDLKDTGVKRKLNGTFYEFGLRMNLELEPGYRWAWIGYPYGGDSLSAQYDIDSDYEVFNIRLFDPITSYDPFTYIFRSNNSEISAETNINVTDGVSLTLDLDSTPGWLVFEDFVGPNSRYNDTRYPRTAGGVCDPIAYIPSFSLSCNYYNATSANGHSNNKWGSAGGGISDAGGPRSGSASAHTNASILTFNSVNTTIYLLNTKNYAFHSSIAGGDGRTMLQFAGQDIIDITKSSGSSSTIKDYKIEYYNTTQAIVYNRVVNDTFEAEWTWFKNLTYLASVEKEVRVYGDGSTGDPGTGWGFTEMDSIYIGNNDYTPIITGDFNSTIIDLNSSVRTFKLNEHYSERDGTIEMYYSFDNGLTYTAYANDTLLNVTDGTSNFMFYGNLTGNAANQSFYPILYNFTLNVTDFQPEALNVTVNQTFTTFNYFLTCNYTYYDQLGDAESDVWYEWTEDTVTIVGQTNSTLPRTEINDGSNYTCKVIVNDGTWNSTQVTSNIFQASTPNVLVGACNNINLDGLKVNLTPQQFLDGFNVTTNLFNMLNVNVSNATSCVFNMTIFNPCTINLSDSNYQGQDQFLNCYEINLTTTTQYFYSTYVAETKLINCTFGFVDMNLSSYNTSYKPSLNFTSTTGAFCYQEQTNESTAGDGSCLLNYTGGYST